MDVFEDLLNLLLPSSCVLCGSSGSNICVACSFALGLKSRSVSRIGISGYACCEYIDSMAKIIHEFKESKQTSLVKLMASEMLSSISNYELQNTVLIPVPSKKESFAQRGFEPANLIANYLARLIAKEHKIIVPVHKVLSYRIQVADQATLSGKDRRTNLLGSMVASNFIRHDSGARKAILIDDIVTTGASLTEAKRCLEEVGVEVIGFLVFAETLPKNRQKRHGSSF